MCTCHPGTEANGWIECRGTDCWAAEMHAALDAIRERTALSLYQLNTAAPIAN